MHRAAWRPFGSWKYLRRRKVIVGARIVPAQPQRHSRTTKSLSCRQLDDDRIAIPHLTYPRPPSVIDFNIEETGLRKPSFEIDCFGRRRFGNMEPHGTVSTQDNELTTNGWDEVGRSCGSDDRI